MSREDDAIVALTVDIMADRDWTLRVVIAAIEVEHELLQAAITPVDNVVLSVIDTLGVALHPKASR